MIRKNFHSILLRMILNFPISFGDADKPKVSS